MKKIITSVLLVLSCQVIYAQKIMGYVQSGGSDEEYAALTDVLFAFVYFNEEGTIQSTSYFYDDVKSKCKTKLNNGKGPRLHASFGGAAAGNIFSNICAVNATRKKLAQNIVNWAVSEGLYGISIDWEFPKISTDIASHEKLLSDIRDAINASTDKTLILSIAVGGEYQNYVNHLNYLSKNAVQYVDEIHVMTYDFWSSYNDNHSTLYDTEMSIDAWHTEFNIPYNKLLLGIPFYARPVTPRENFTTYGDEPDYIEAFNKTDESAVADGMFFNSKDAIQKKVKLVKDKNLLGLFIWSIEQDRQLPDPYSLLGSIKEVTGISENIQNVGGKIYPNPSNDKFTLKFESEKNVNLKIFNAIGNEVGNIIDSGSVFNFGANLPLGLYCIIGKIDNKDIFIKIIKE